MNRKHSVMQLRHAKLSLFPPGDHRNLRDRLAIEEGLHGATGRIRHHAVST